MEPDIDCTGLQCPEPVLRTKKKLENSSEPFTVLVDNPTARDNVSRFARSAGGEAAVEESEGGYFVRVTPPGETARADRREAMSCAPRPESRVLFVGRDEMGGGERELGQSLMKMFLYAASVSDEKIDTLIFMNSGVRLVTENEETADHVRALQEKGTVVLVCGTCLDYYGLTDDLRVGQVSNMYDIQNAMIGAGLLLSL